MRSILFTFLLMLAGLARAQNGKRTVLDISSGWEFTKATDAPSWRPVNLPHTWNLSDVMDDEPGYYRGKGLYLRSIFIGNKFRGKEIYLRFEGANQVTRVLINGREAGTHKGGYAAFTIPVTEFVRFNADNELKVEVDNSYDETIPPLSADFTFYGGLYRQVSLLVLEPVHFDVDDHGATAVYVSTPLVNDTEASVHIRYKLINRTNAPKQFVVASTVYDAKGKKITAIRQPLKIPGSSSMDTAQNLLPISDPRLWSPDDPYLYKLVTRLIEEGSGAILDEVTNPLAFRWYSFEPDEGFFLNGKSLKLVGTSRHQDYEGMGNAVPEVLAKEDLLWLKKMGGNFLRVAHYPQDPVVLHSCDSLGILASVEIPVVNEISESASFFATCIEMQEEMIRQSFNHPSVIIWCSMNEVLLRPHYNDDKPKQEIYFAQVARLARTLDSLTRELDPDRYTMIAFHGDYERYRRVGLVDIPMIAGWNLYSGWYGPRISDFPVFLDAFHKNYPHTPLIVSEYGADADPRIHSTHPVRFDKSVEYTVNFHQYYITEMMKRPFVSAAVIWNLADFNSETRTESMPHINNKGLLTWNRIPKDPYYYYQARLSKTPFLKILGNRNATGMADSATALCTRTLQVAANTPSAELMINGISAGVASTNDGICEWKLSFRDGDNRVEVKTIVNGKSYSDEAIFSFRVQPYLLKSEDPAFSGVNILLGADRYFTAGNGECWMPDQPYRKGSWGSIGGKPFTAPGNTRLPYGTDKDIKGTADDPLYQTQRIGIEQYRFDVSDGDYELTFHFAELLGGAVSAIPYNLSDPDRIEPNGKRVFNVYINGADFLSDFNIAEKYGTATAVTKTVRLQVHNNEGITIRFSGTEGEPVLNALQLKKIDEPSKLLLQNESNQY